MHKHASFVQRKTIEAWDVVLVNIQRMYQSADVRPFSGYDVFKFDTSVGDDEVKLRISPFVLNVPERAVHLDANLFIVMKDWLSFEGDDMRSGPLVTKSFGTQVGYFRQSKTDENEHSLEHVYGLHYDIDEVSPGHPVFHAQFGPQMDFETDIDRLYPGHPPIDDKVSPILRNVRIPTAQMDIFSVITQICADHLMYHDSGSEVKKAFLELRSCSGFFTGAGYRLSYLNQPSAPTCYRSIHWYSAT